MKATRQELENLDRLRKRSDFLRAGANPQKWVSKSFIFLAAPNELTKPRFGITVTKKLEKSAVRRNRIKRRLRAAAADVLPLKAKAGMDYILIARDGASARPYSDLVRDLGWCLEKTGNAV